MGSELSIGKLAETARVNIETNRYDQRRGLLDEPTKPSSGHRRYSAKAIKRVRFIKRAQALAFTLTEVGGLLTLNAACACTETRALGGRDAKLPAKHCLYAKSAASPCAQCARNIHNLAIREPLVKNKSRTYPASRLRCNQPE